MRFLESRMAAYNCDCRTESQIIHPMSHEQPGLLQRSCPLDEIHAKLRGERHAQLTATQHVPASQWGALFRKVRLDPGPHELPPRIQVQRSIPADRSRGIHHGDRCRRGTNQADRATHGKSTRELGQETLCRCPHGIPRIQNRGRHDHHLRARRSLPFFSSQEIDGLPRGSYPRRNRAARNDDRDRSPNVATVTPAGCSSSAPPTTSMRQRHRKLSRGARPGRAGKSRPSPGARRIDCATDSADWRRAGLHRNKVVVAVARELIAFIWETASPGDKRNRNEIHLMNKKSTIDIPGVPPRIKNGTCRFGTLLVSLSSEARSSHRRELGVKRCPRRSVPSLLRDRLTPLPAVEEAGSGLAEAIPVCANGSASTTNYTK